MKQVMRLTALFGNNLSKYLNRLFFTKIDEESVLGKTIQGLDDKGKVVVEDNRWVY